MTSEFEGGLDAFFHYLEDHASPDEIHYFLLAVESRAPQLKFRAQMLTRNLKRQPVRLPGMGQELTH